MTDEDRKATFKRRPFPFGQILNLFHESSDVDFAQISAAQTVGRFLGPFVKIDIVQLHVAILALAELVGA
jgi:hypothetical protein